MEEHKQGQMVENKEKITYLNNGKTSTNKDIHKFDNLFFHTPFLMDNSYPDLYVFIQITQDVSLRLAYILLYSFDLHN